MKATYPHPNKQIFADTKYVNLGFVLGIIGNKTGLS
jgi:hypothetical protein